MSIRRIATRFLQFGSSPYIHLTNLKGLDSSCTFNALRGYSSLSSISMKLNCRYVNNRQICQIASPNGKQLFQVDTLALVRRLEAQGVPTKQAEAITGAVIQVLNDSLDNVSHSFVSKAEMQKASLVSKAEMQKIEISQECNLSKFKSEVQSSQEHHFGLLQRETEKLKVDIEKMRNELRVDIEKMRSELRYEIDKITAGQRLDLNLEKGRIRDELADQKAETSNLTNKLDREIYALKAHLEGAKYDVIKYCVGTLVSAAAVGLAVLRTLKP